MIEICITTFTSTYSLIPLHLYRSLPNHALNAYTVCPPIPEPSRLSCDFLVSGNSFLFGKSGIGGRRIHIDRLERSETSPG